MARATHILAGAAAIVALAACSGADAPAAKAAAANPECVPIADGTYEIRGGKILAMAPNASRPEPAPISSTAPAMSEEPVGWAAKLERSFGGRGYPWMGLQVRDDIAVLTGTAPGMAARDVSFIAGKAALEADAEGKEKVNLVVNGMSVEGSEEGSIGAGLSALMASDLSLSDCQQAFDLTLRTDDVDFPVNTTDLTAAELPVMDALTGIARLCSNYRMEIAEHTDSRGSDSYNLQLSRQRADVIKAYLVEHGVDETVLKAAGYGESQPIDPANTPEARAKNERTEIVVSPGR